MKRHLVAFSSLAVCVFRLTSLSITFIFRHEEKPCLWRNSVHRINKTRYLSVREGFVRMSQRDFPQTLYLLRRVEDIQFLKFPSPSSHSRSMFYSNPTPASSSQIFCVPIGPFVGHGMCQVEAERMSLVDFRGSASLLFFFLSTSPTCEDHVK